MSHRRAPPGTWSTTTSWRTTSRSSGWSPAPCGSAAGLGPVKVSSEARSLARPGCPCTWCWPGRAGGGTARVRQCLPVGLRRARPSTVALAVVTELTCSWLSRSPTRRQDISERRPPSARDRQTRTADAVSRPMLAASVRKRRDSDPMDAATAADGTTRPSNSECPSVKPRDSRRRGWRPHGSRAARGWRGAVTPRIPPAGSGPVAGPEGSRQPARRQRLQPTRSPVLPVVSSQQDRARQQDAPFSVRLLRVGPAASIPCARAGTGADRPADGAGPLRAMSRSRRGCSTPSLY